jgi:hypothetical protein
MQGAQGHQIYPMAEQSGEFVNEFLDLPAQPPSGRYVSSQMRHRFLLLSKLPPGTEAA